MRRFLVLLLLAGCGTSIPPSPDELALQRYADAQKRFSEGRYAEAAADFEAVVAERDLIRDAWWRLADCYERLGNRPAAARTLRRWLALQPTDVEARRRLEGLSS